MAIKYMGLTVHLFFSPILVAVTGPGMEGRKVAEEEEARLKLLKTLHYLWSCSAY